MLVACASAAVLPGDRLDVVVRQDIIINKQSPDPSQSAQPSQQPQPILPLPQFSPPLPSPPRASQVVVPSATPSPGASLSSSPTQSVAPSPSTTASSVALIPSPSVSSGAAGAGVATRRGGANAGVIVGVVIGALLLLSLIILLLVVVFRGRNGDASGGPPPASGAGGYSTPESATRGLGAAAAAGGAGGAAVAARGTSLPTDNSDGGTIQDIELAEAEATMPSYTVSDAARHHGGVATGAVLPAAAGAGAAGEVVATTGRDPSPPPHDYVVGAGPIASRTDFDDIKTRFARDEIGDSTAILGASSLIEGATDPTTTATETEAKASDATTFAPADQGSTSMPDVTAPPPQQPRGAGMSDVVPDAPTPPSFNGVNGNEELSSSGTPAATFIANPRGEESAPPADIITEEGSSIPTDVNKPIVVEAPRSAVEATFEIAPESTNVSSKPDRPIDPAPISFDTQDKFSHSAQDLSGSISEAVPTFTAPTQEEMAETASLDRDAMPPPNK